MIKVKYGLLNRNVEREHKLRQLFQELHQIFNTKIFRDKAILKKGVLAKSQIEEIILASKALDSEEELTIFIVHPKEISFKFFRLFYGKFIYLHPLYLDLISTRGLGMDLIEQFYIEGPLSPMEVRELYDSIHRSIFGDIYRYAVRDLEPYKSFLGLKKYNWSRTC